MIDVFVPASAAIDEKLRERKKLIVAIDGRCASGKTTLAQKLKQHYGCGVVHMDHFFLRPEQRSAERLDTPGGNVDYERVLREVIMPLEAGKEVSYCPYDCQSGRLSPPVRLEKSDLVIIEGAYSCHPTLWEHYGLRIFLTVDPKEQMRRLSRREPADKLEVFNTKWIPFEEKYFAAFAIEKRCDKRLSTSPDRHI